MRQSGLVLLLPHGFDGTGPEHSSSKIERFLQLVDTNGINSLAEPKNLPDHRKINMGVAQITKPSNYFHILRRQMLRKYRKPLIVATPKIGLKHSSYTSNINEFLENKHFEPIIVDNYNSENLKNLKGVVFCSGQIFLEINKQLGDKKDYIIIRIEELAPFPEEIIISTLKNINKKSKFFWVQEESMNMGCFSYVAPHLRRIARNLTLENTELNYIGRDAQVGANGCQKDHKAEVDKLLVDIKTIFTL